VAQRNLWRTANPWVPHEWVTMKEAWLRVHAALSENMRLTRRDLKAHLLAKRLVGAARIIAPDGSERCIIFEPAFWEPVELPYAYLVSGCEKHASEGEAWHFFVRRRELDKHYPIGERPETATLATSSSPQRRKPGPKIKKDWRLYVAAETHRIRETENRTPSAAELALLCEQKLNYQPDPSDIQKLLRMLLGD
jgi:hypothetical protein